MYTPLRYIDPSGWLPGKPGNSRPDDPPGLGNYRPGIYNPTDSESAWHVCLPDVYVFATSDGYNANTNTTNYTEGTKWNNNEQYSYLGTDTRPMPTLGSGGGGGGSIGMGPNNQWGNSKLTPSVVNNVATGAGTITGYQKSVWEKPKSRAQKAINQKKAYETQKALKQKGITKSVKEIKAGKVANLRTGGYVLGGLSIGLEGYEIVKNQEIRVSNCVNIVAVGLGVVFWEVSLAYLVIDAGSMLITGNSIGSHIDTWCKNPIIDW